MFPISLSTNWFFFMFARHSASGRPVLADCCFAKSSGVCEPSPSGSSAFMYRSPATFMRAISSAIGILRSASRAADALRMSR